MGKTAHTSALGIDIGGTGIKSAIVDLTTGKLSQAAIYKPTPQPSTPDRVRELVETVVRELCWEGAVGIGYPGVVIDGIAHSAAHMDKSWINYDIRSLVDGDDRKASALNDADAAGLAEVRFGAGMVRNYERGGSVLLLTFGTGIGSALIYNGRLVPNTEFGHAFLQSGIETEAWAAGSIKTSEQLSWMAWAERVNDVLALLDQLLSPELVIVGGGISERFADYQPFLRSRAEIVAAKLGNDAGIVGAALATRDL